MHTLFIFVAMVSFSVITFAQTGEMLRLIREHGVQKGFSTHTGVPVVQGVVDSDVQQVAISTAPASVVFRMAQFSTAQKRVADERTIALERRLLGPISIGASEQQFSAAHGYELRERAATLKVRLKQTESLEVVAGGVAAITSDNSKEKDRVKILALAAKVSKSWSRYSIDASVLVGRTVYENGKQIGAAYNAGVEVSRKVRRLSVGAFWKLVRRPAPRQFVRQEMQGGVFLRYDSGRT